MDIVTQREIIHPASMLEDIQLTATLPHEMVSAQHDLLDWCDKKISIVKLECQELQEATDHAKKMKWKHSALQNQYYKSVKRLSYYEKIIEALLHGYYIVPNFPIQMFAIRTTREGPKLDHSWNYWGDKTQSAQELPINEGEYKNPFPLVKRTNQIKDSIGKLIQEAASYATDWDEFEFPITMAKPEIMQATSRTMALKIFDRIGIMPAMKKEDPVIIGQIFRKEGYSTKVVSFLIAWHLNTNMI